MSAQRSLRKIWHVRVFRLAWPIIVSMLSYTAMTVADSIYVGRLGTAPLAAIGLASVLVFAGVAFGEGLLSGVRVNVAQSTGGNRHTLARQYAWQGLWLAVGLGCWSASLAPLGPAAFDAMGASTAVVGMASVYFGIRMVFAPLAFAGMALSAWFQGRGDTRTPMVAAVVGNVANIVIDPVLIFGFGPVAPMGIAGAAWATAIGQALMVCILAARAYPQLAGSLVGFRRDLLSGIWTIGAPIGLQHTLDVASYALFATLLARAGDVHLAAHVIVVRILMVSFLPGHAIGEASGVLVGHSLGAGKPHRAREAHRAATVQALAIMLTCGVAFVAIPDVLTAVFGAEPNVRALARQVVLIAAGIQLFDAVATVGLGSLGGAGDTRFVMVVCLVGAWFTMLPVAVVLVTVFELGVVGAWTGIAVEIAFLAVVCSWRIRGSTWLQSYRIEADDVPLPAAAK